VIKFKNRKGRAPGDKKCSALNTSGGYICETFTATRSIRAFALLGVRARKLVGLICILTLTSCGLKDYNLNPWTTVLNQAIKYDARK